MGSFLRRRVGLELCRVLVRPAGAALHTLQRGSGFTFRALAEPEVLACCGDPELELRTDAVQAAFARGDVCLAALEGARVVGYAWLAFGPAPHTRGTWVHFDPRGRYSYKKFVRPAYRGRRIAHGLNALADAPLYLRRRQFTVHFVNLDNHASLRSTTRSGSRSVGYAGILRCGQLALTFRTPGAGSYGFRFVAEAPRPAAPRPFSKASSRG